MGAGISDLFSRFGVRLKLAVALTTVIAGYSLFFIVESNHELERAHDESVREQALTLARSFNGRSIHDDLARRGRLQAALDRLQRQHPELIRASVYADHRGEETRIGTTDPTMASSPPSAHDLQPIETGQPVFTLEEAGGEEIGELNYPLEDASGNVHASLGVYFDLSSQHAALAAKQRKLWIFGGIAALASLALLLSVLSRSIFGPLGALGRTARAIGEGQLAARLGWQRRDELGRLGRDFDRMAAAVEDRERLLKLTMTDPLTGLASHRRFHEVLRSEIEECRARGAELSLLLFDLDRFKSVNQRWGHPRGDEVLESVAKKLDGAVPAAALVARVGGEQFAAVISGCSLPEALGVAEDARAAIARVPLPEGELSCSVGIACCPSHASSAGTLIELAEGALSLAKETGRDRARAYDPLQVHVRSSEQEREEIEAILEDPEALRIAFQPIVDLQTGSVAGFEALSRFAGDPPPSPIRVFVQAHRCGLGAKLELEAVRRAVASTGRPHGSFVSVNLSPTVASSDSVARLLSGLPEGELVVELTEHEMVAAGPALLASLERLRADCGALIAVDDAGAGYAGLSQIAALRPDIVKVDRSLVAGVDADAARKALIESFVSFAGKIGARVCAEGVEHYEEGLALRDIGVDLAQGYLFARPEPAWPAAESLGSLAPEPAAVAVNGRPGGPVPARPSA